MTQRTVSILQADCFEDAKEGMGYGEVWKAVGYLATWAATNDRYAHCSIVCDDNGDIMARYSREPGGDQTYSILAQADPDNKTYSFHS